MTNAWSDAAWLALGVTVAGRIVVDIACYALAGRPTCLSSFASKSDWADAGDAAAISVTNITGMDFIFSLLG